jgi:3'-phosphoadenosine 5'-phosphosulfate sulfotransferase (PAPS reductase)/FAD synthetase
MDNINRFIAFSGGIDSTALALLTPDATPVFTDTNWEFPHVYEHIDRFEKVTGREVVRLSHPEWPGGLPEYIRHHAFMPGHGARYCTRIFKIETYNRWIVSRLPAEMLIGLRYDEPESMRVGNLTNMNGLTIKYPLRELELTRMDCVRVCAENNLLPQYPVYAARGGCVGCFYKRKTEVQAMAALIPDVMDKLQELEEEVQDERGKYAFLFPSTGTSIRDLRSQSLLFTADEVYASASQTGDVGQACGVFCNGDRG